jgi:beta-lactamase regulating signal transducer with metallopeptidase domain
MIPVDEGLAQLAWTQAWQVTILILTVAVLTRLVARNRPHLAHVLWLVVLVKCVTPPVFSSTSGVFCWMQTGAPRVSAQPLSKSDSGFGAVSRPPHRSAALAGQEYPPQLGTEFTPPAESAGAENHAIPPTPDRHQWVAGSLMAGWLAGALVMFGLAAVRLIACWRLIRRSGFRTDRSLDRLTASLSRRLKLWRPARLVITESLVGPAVIGLFRATVLMPEVMVRDKSAEDLEPILAHELMHVRRGDLWVGMLQMAAQAVWWFHPLVWWAGRLASREAERCCDEAVVAELGCDPARYARCLFDVLEQKRVLKPLPAFPGVRPVEVTSRRLERIMKLGQGSRKRSPWWCWAVMVLAAALILPGAALMIAADDDPAVDLKHPPLPVPQDWQLAAYGSNSYGMSPSMLTAPGPEPVEARSYPVNDLLVSVRSRHHVGVRQAKDFLLDMLGYATRTPSPTGTIRSVEWTDEHLIVRDTAKSQERIAFLLDVMRKHGFDRIAVKVWFLRCSRETIDTLGLDWTITHVAVSPGDTVQQMVPVPTIEFPWPDGQPAPPSRAQIVVEKTLPVTYAILDPRQAMTVADRFQDDKRASVMQAPKVTVLNGQPACIVDCSWSPFVVGFTDDRQPRIRVVSEGTVFRVRTLLREENSLQLDYELQMPRIGKVETVTLPSSPGEKPTTLQVPEVETARVSGSVELPDGDTLLIGGLKWKDANGDPESVFVMICPTKLATMTPQPSQPALVLTSYDVRALVVPILKEDPASGNATATGKVMFAHAHNGAGSHFQALTDLITATIAPGTWKEAGGPGSIESSQADLTFAVLQTEEVHEEIVKLFEKLRRSQRIQITLDSRIVHLPGEMVERIGIEFGAEENHTTLTKREARMFRAFVDASDSARIRSLTKVTVFNGQLADMPRADFTGSYEINRLALHPNCSDGRTISLAYAVNPKDPDMPLAGSKRVPLTDDQTLLLDVTGQLETSDAVPLSGDSGDDDENAPKTYILITPSILIQEEEEERLIMGGVTPRIIIKEEEEERLGILNPGI